MAVDTYSSEPEKPSVPERLSPKDSVSQLSQEENQALKKYRVKVYVVKSDILYRVVDDVPLVVVPTPMQVQVVRRVHERGHFGVTRTEALLRRDFWFKGMRQKLEKDSRRCADCILTDHMKPWVVGEEDDFPEDSDSNSETSGDRCQVRTAECSIVEQWEFPGKQEEDHKTESQRGPGPRASVFEGVECVVVEGWHEGESSA